MLNLRERLYRVTMPGTVTVDGKSEHFPLGRIVDNTKHDVEELEMHGVETARVIPDQP